MLNGVIPASYSGHLRAALRIITGLLFMEHGLTKLIHWPATDYFPVGQPLFAVGAFTRLTAFILAGMMAVAYFMAHMPSSFFPIQNGGDAAVLFCFIFLYFAATGAGPFSVDANRGK
jgi:putative oxidoreductase